MSGSSSVTVPGKSNGSQIVTVALGTGDVLHLASQIGALLSTIAGSGRLDVWPAGMGALPTPSDGSGTLSELYITGGTGSDTIPSGYSYVLDNSFSPTTLSGSNVPLIAGTTGGSFNVTGQSTVAVEGGNNQISATGTYLISTAPGNDTISAIGSGTIAGALVQTLFSLPEASI